LKLERDKQEDLAEREREKGRWGEGLDKTRQDLSSIKSEQIKSTKQCRN